MGVALILLIGSWFVIGGLVWLLYLVTRRHGKTLKAYHLLQQRVGYLEDLIGNASAPSLLANDSSIKDTEPDLPDDRGPSAPDHRFRQSTLQRNGLSAGVKAPHFTLPDLTGRGRSLDEFRGKRVVLVFSDPACGPCQVLAPKLEELYQLNKQDNLVVLIVSRGEPSINREKAAEQGLSFPILLQRHWEVSKAYGMFATPIGYLINESGVLVSDVAIGGDAILGLLD